MTITTGGPSATGGSKAIGQTTASASHTHSCTTTTDAGSNIPPYIDVIFAQRNDPAMSTSLGSEEPQETKPGEEEVTYQYTYNGDGAMVMESTGMVTTIYIGGIYEYEISGAEVITRSYYYVGSQRVAMREDGELFYLLGDHLGSNSLTLDAGGNKVAEQRYKPWGEIRFSSGSQVTDYTFTGQRDRFGEFGLLYYNARWYDSYLNRWVQPDSIVPGTPSLTTGVFDDVSSSHFTTDPTVSSNPIVHDRYAYAVNNPVKYTDPDGHCVILCAVLIGAAVSVAVDYIVTTQVKQEDYSWKRAAVAAAIGGIGGGIGAAVIAPVASAIGGIATTAASSTYLVPTTAAISNIGTAATVTSGMTMSAVANVGLASTQRSLNNMIEGGDFNLRSEINTNWKNDAFYGALSFGLGYNFGNWIDSTFWQPSEVIAPLLNMNPSQKIFIGALEAGASAISDEDVLDATFNWVTQPLFEAR